MSVEQDHIAELRRSVDELRAKARERGIDASAGLESLEAQLAAAQDEAMAKLSRYDRVQLARNQDRPVVQDYIEALGADFFELKGDRAFRDDPAIVGGWLKVEGASVMAIGQRKGRNMKENVRYNFGLPHPEGYRKAKRLMKLAEKFGRPVVTFIDTQGAYPGIGAEERGQGEAIAANLLAMAGLGVPIVSCVIGEGGSGGALGIGVADRVLMMENAIYSVISPEGCAAILWRSRKSAEAAAEALKLTARDLNDLGVVDEVVREPAGGAHTDRAAAAQLLADAVKRHLRELRGTEPGAIVESRRAKYYALGVWEER